MFLSTSEGEVGYCEVQPGKLPWAQQPWTKLNFCFEASKAKRLLHQDLGSLILQFLGPRGRKLCWEGVGFSNFHYMRGA